MRLVLIGGRPCAAGPPNRRRGRRLERTGLDKTESWSFADRFNERLRYEIDPAWAGELPHTVHRPQRPGRRCCLVSPTSPRSKPMARPAGQALKLAARATISSRPVERNKALTLRSPAHCRCHPHLRPAGIRTGLQARPCSRSARHGRAPRRPPPQSRRRLTHHHQQGHDARSADRGAQRRLRQGRDPRDEDGRQRHAHARARQGPGDPARRHRDTEARRLPHHVHGAEGAARQGRQGPVTLVFEKAGSVEVDTERSQAMGARHRCPPIATEVATAYSVSPSTRYIACRSTQAIMAMPITDTNQASVRSQGMPAT